MAGSQLGGQHGSQLGGDDGGLLGLPLLYPPLNLQVSNLTKTTADLTWTDNNPDEYGFVLEHSKQYPTGFGPWRQATDVGVDVESVVDDTLQQGNTYRWRLYATNVAGEAYSNVAEGSTSPSGAKDKPIPKDWHVEIDHPDTVKPLTPDPLEGAQKKPIANALPKVEIPVERDEKWQSDVFTEATMRVWVDGERQPIDTLVRARMEEGKTVLIGRGGSELLTKIEREIDFADAHAAAESLIDDNTGYVSNVDDPASSIDEDVTMATADTEPEWGTFLAANALDADVPAKRDGTDLTATATAQFVSGEDADLTGGGTGINDSYEGSEFAFFSTISEGISATVQFEHDIPAGSVGFAWRGGYRDGTHPKIEWTVNGETAFLVDTDQDFTSQTMPRWFSTGGISSGISADQDVTINYELDDGGTNRTGEFTANHGTFEEITYQTTDSEGNTITVTEDEHIGPPTVYDNNDTYTEGTDYEVDFRNAEIKALSGGELTDGTTYSVDYVADSDAAYDESDILIDCFCVYDQRYTESITQDTLSSGGALSWPNIGPDAVPLETQDYQTPFTVVGGGAEGTFNDTSNGQAIAVSNDQGQNWTEAPNSSSVDEPSFDSGSAQIRGRFTLSYFDDGSTSGSKYSGIQSVDTGTLLADLDDTPTLANRTSDAQLRDILSQIADDRNFLWEVRWDDSAGTMSVEFTQPGQRFSDEDPDVGGYQIDKQTEDLVEQLTVKGASQPRSGESIDGRPENNPWVLDEFDLVPRKEAVTDTDSDTQYVRGDDYNISYLDGEVWIIDSGEMVEGDTYEIDYQYKTRGTYPEEGEAPSDAREDSQTIPGLGSARICRQAAYYIVQRSKNPIWEGTISLPKQELGWSVVDSINPDKVPTSGNQLEVVSITETPSTIDVEIRNRRTVSEIVDDLSSGVDETQEYI